MGQCPASCFSSSLNSNTKAIERNFDYVDDDEVYYNDNPKCQNNNEYYNNINNYNNNYFLNNNYQIKQNNINKNHTLKVNTCSSNYGISGLNTGQMFLNINNNNNYGFGSGIPSAGSSNKNVTFCPRNRLKDNEEEILCIICKKEITFCNKLMCPKCYIYGCRKCFSVR